MIKCDQYSNNNYKILAVSNGFYFFSINHPEIIMYCFALIILAFYVTKNHLVRVFLIATVFIRFYIEMMNDSIELTNDNITCNTNENIKIAKDIASAVSYTSLLSCLSAYAYVIYYKL